MAAPKPVLSMRFEQLKIFTGNANPMLAAKICASLGCPVGKASVNRFSDGEIDLQIQENVRGADVFVVQPTCTPVDRHLMELLLMIDALKRASAQSASPRCYPIMGMRGRIGRTGRGYRSPPG